MAAYESPSTGDLLFVYGTLRKGFHRHDTLSILGAQFLGKGTIRGELFNLHDYPGARPASKPTTHVAGEVYRLRRAARALRILDKVEGYSPSDLRSSLFRREQTQVVLKNGQRVIAWVYWLNRMAGPLWRIRSGDYARR